MISKKQRYEFCIEYFLKHRPQADTELVYTDPYQLLVAVILSAQCTDKRVNMITPEFFNKFPDAKSLAKSTDAKVFELIKSCSYPNNKARNLLGMSRMLTKDFKGVMPDNIEDLQKLPGVGRKTANVIVSVVYKKPAMAVDTHVFRVAARIGLTTNAKTPFETEMQLVKNIPEKYVGIAHHWLILHGRYICQARKPLCEKCGISEICKFYNGKK
jgi:endonuclease III